MIYQRWDNMKFKYRNRQFWCRGYYVDTVGKAIQEYVANQLKADKELEIVYKGEKLERHTGMPGQYRKRCGSGSALLCIGPIKITGDQSVSNFF